MLDLGQIILGVHIAASKIRRYIDLQTAIAVSQLVLKHRENKNLVGSRRSLNSNHHLVDFSHALLGWESGQPPAQRANVALIPAAIKSTRLVANANRPEGISAFPVSPYHTTKTIKPATFSYTKPATVFLYTQLTI